MADNDDFIHADVYYMLSCNLALPLHGVTARVENGCVILLGHVDWPFQKAEAERGILKHSGATGIVNQITVRDRPDVDTGWPSKVSLRPDHSRQSPAR